MTERTQFNIYLPPELIRAVKHAAVDAGSSLSAYVQVALEAHLARAQRPDEETR